MDFLKLGLEKRIAEYRKGGNDTHGDLVAAVTTYPQTWLAPKSRTVTNVGRVDGRMIVTVSTETVIAQDLGDGEIDF